MLALIVVGILGLFSCEKETVSEMERNKSQLREAESYDFSEIYKRFHDGSLKNYEDVKFVPKPKKEALQYVENVLNYLTGTPGKYSGKELMSISSKIKINSEEEYSPDYQLDLVKKLLKGLPNGSNEIIYAIDIDIQERIKDSIEIHYFISPIEATAKTTACPDWNYIFPNAPWNYTINNNIKYFWVGPDSKPCHPDQCGSSCYMGDLTFEHAVNGKYVDPLTASGQYLINVETFTFDYRDHSCSIIRDTVQSWIYRADANIDYITSTHPNLVNKEFIGADMYHIAWFKYWPSCGGQVGKFVRVDYLFGNYTNIPPSP